MSFKLYTHRCISAMGLIFSLLYADVAKSQENTSGYKKPPQEITEMVEHAVSRSVIFSGEGNHMVILEEQGYPSIAEIAQPKLGLAGLRINPKNFSNGKAAFYSSLSVKDVHRNKEISIQNLPPKANIREVSFSPDGHFIAFTNTDSLHVELWIANLETGMAKKFPDIYLNDVYGKTYEWASDGQSILAKCIASGQTLPAVSEVPAGPNVQENTGKAAPSRTYQDLLKSKTDEQLFDYYLTCQLKMLYLNGQAVNFGLPDLYKSFEFSPDGKLVMTSIIHKPYSYLVPVSAFPNRVEIRDKYGKILNQLADLSLQDQLPQGFDAVPTGPREFGWRADKPQTVFWVEAQDEGNPNLRSFLRDIIYTRGALDAKGSQKKLAECYLRFNHIDWGDDQIAIINERWWKTRGERRVFIKPGNPSYRVNLWDRYYEDAYNDPGDFVKTKNEYNRDVLLLDYNSVKRLADPNNMWIFSISEGSSPKGDRPFLLKFNVKTKMTDTLFHSKAPFYEKPVFFDQQNLIISRESEIEPPNYIDIDLDKHKEQQLTFFKNPYPQLFGVLKQQISYQRADKLNLTATLYLPKNYNVSQGRLPVLMWAYPKEFKTASAAGQVKGSPYKFNKLSWASPVYWVTQGYAILDNVDMPIVGESNENPNDTFIAQLTQNAEAAINKITAMGVADPKRIAIGGHSYGAFMTANLLAHTRLFAAGIARSGAYNRTLTPFGFQAEERNYWEAPDLYYNMSPFSYANKIQDPLLLIHGEADDNPGTFPIQSERFYNALKGFGATTRLVYLPAEAHSYRAKESVLHMLYEMDYWLNKYVKNKGKVN